MHNGIKQKNLFTAVAALFCCGLWGVSTPIVKMGYAYTDAAHVPSLLLWAGIQFALAGLMTIFVYSIIKRRVVYPKKQNLTGVLLISLFQTVLQYTLLYIGLLHTTSVKGAILKSTDVFFVALISSLIFKLEKLTVKKLISCIIGFAGIVIMNLDGLSLNIQPLGDGFVVLGIAFYSLSVVLVKLIGHNEDPIVLSGYQMTLGGIIMLLIGIVFQGNINFAGMLPIILFLSAIYAVSYSVWTFLLKNNPASSVTIYSFMTPVFGVLFSALLLSEAGGVPLINLVVALVLVCFGIILWGHKKQ